MRVQVDMSLCKNYGQCVFEAPDIFRLTEEGTLEYTAMVPENTQAAAEAAADACPVQAITLVLE